MSTETADPLDLARVADLCGEALQAAKQAGADSADAVVLAGRSLSATVREGAVEEAEQAESTDIGLRVFVGARSALVNVGSLAGLKAAAERAVAMAKAAPEDDTQGLAPAESLFQGPVPDLDIFDPTLPTMEDLIARAHTLEAAMRPVAGVTKSGGASASARHAARAMATSHGFTGAYATSTHSHGATAVAGDGTRMERDHWYSSRRHLADLEAAERVGLTAAERAVRRIGGEPISTRTATIVFEPRAAVGFLGHLVSAINGAAIARGASMLAGKRGEKVLADGITVRDTPGIVRGLASRPFDGEGLACETLDLVADGVLAEYLLDQQSARKLGLAANGRAARGTGAPSPSATNVSVIGGRGTMADLMKEAGSGLLVTDLIGVGANIVNGNYSRGAAGFWFENGEIVQPVAEITIAGQLDDMFARAIFADDAPGLYVYDAPSIALSGMTIGGR